MANRPSAMHPRVSHRELGAQRDMKPGKEEKDMGQG
jgi:hypothetical protein